MSCWAEVVEPSTRALVDEDSEEEYPASQPAEGLTRFQLKWIEENTSGVDLFIVAHGKLITSFVKSFVCDEKHELVAEIQESLLKDVKEREPESAPLIKSASPVYRLNKGTSYICLCADVDMNNANKFRNAILPLLEKSSHIVIVSAQKASTYLYDRLCSELNIPFVRCLQSSTYQSGNISAPYLEQPNFVTGIPAAILSWCEVFNVPGILYCCFTDTHEVNSISSEPLIKIFSSLSVEVLDPSKVKFKKKSYGPVTTNLYM